MLPQEKEYLGALFTSDGNMKCEMVWWVRVALAVLRKLYRIIVGKS